MNIATCIQCRDSSERMTNKSVRPFYKGESILEIILRKLRMIDMRNVFILTSRNSPMTIDQAKKWNVKTIIGSEDDVLSRFYTMAVRYRPDGIIRICADNPFVSLSLMYPIRKWGKTQSYDYVSYDRAMLRHEGLFSEYIKADTIIKLHNMNLDKYDRNHVTSYIYTHPDEFNMKILDVPFEMEILPIRLTVDTMSDFRIAQSIYRSLGDPYWLNIYNFLFNKKKILKKMQKNMEMNKK